MTSNLHMTLRHHPNRATKQLNPRSYNVCYALISKNTAKLFK
jgi:hypothetical protein